MSNIGQTRKAFALPIRTEVIADYDLYRNEIAFCQRRLKLK